MRVIAILVTILLSGHAVASDKSSTPSSIEVVRTAFGVFNPPGTGQPPFVPSTVVPLIVGQAYGWVIVVRTSSKTVRWREEFTLPAEPATWGPREPIGTRSMSDDRRTTITEREVGTQNGVLFNSWSVAAGDPVGTYRMRVSIDGQFVRAFEFQVK